MKCNYIDNKKDFIKILLDSTSVSISSTAVLVLLRCPKKFNPPCMILGFIQNAVLNNSFATVEILRGIICDRVSSLQKNFNKYFSETMRGC